MISKIKNSVFTKVLWALMGLYLLNISVDSPDPNPQHVPEDLSINDQESIVELIVEKVLGFEDAIKEYDDLDSEDHNYEKNLKVNLLALVPDSKSYFQLQVTESRLFYYDYDVRLLIASLEIDSPPPKA